MHFEQNPKLHTRVHLKISFQMKIILGVAILINLHKKNIPKTHCAKFITLQVAIE